MASQRKFNTSPFSEYENFCYLFGLTPAQLAAQLGYHRSQPTRWKQAGLAPASVILECQKMLTNALDEGQPMGTWTVQVPRAKEAFFKALLTNLGMEAHSEGKPSGPKGRNTRK